jgi:hypothetical protein
MHAFIHSLSYRLRLWQVAEKPTTRQLENFCLSMRDLPHHRRLYFIDPPILRR